MAGRRNRAADMSLDMFAQAPELAQSSSGAGKPLADRVRPETLDEIVGQEHLLGPGRALRKIIEADDLVSMILWGPPGVGKTTLARVIAKETGSEFHSLSAVTAGVADVRRVLERARRNRQAGKRTILFIDEIHRFNKAQQDALLHAVEDGTIVLIGATTENPSFEIIGPLLSRCRVFTLRPLDREAMRRVLERALRKDPWLRSKSPRFAEGALELLVELSGGDARVALNALELAVRLAAPADKGVEVTPEHIREALQQPALLYDKKGDYHYDLASAFIKSIRGSDPDAAVYWMARMLEGGEDPRFIARRLVILASEDIGNADPQALILATSGFAAVDLVGMPEARIILAQVATYLASAPKSNAAYVAISEATEDVRQKPLVSVPLHLRNAPTRLMKQLGYAAGYKYPHDYEGGFVRENYRPPEDSRKVYYRPTQHGFEKRLRDRLRQLWPERYRDKE